MDELNFKKMTKKTLLKKTYFISLGDQAVVRCVGPTGLHEVGEGDADQELLQYRPGELIKKKPKKNSRDEK